MIHVHAAVDEKQPSVTCRLCQKVADRRPPHIRWAHQIVAIRLGIDLFVGRLDTLIGRSVIGNNDLVADIRQLQRLLVQRLYEVGAAAVISGYEDG